MAEAESSAPHPIVGDGLKLAVGALGVVYGDIGTSPLYALKECVAEPHGVAATSANVLGVLSLIFWSLTLVVTLKYLVFVLRADNNGEGGVLALMSLVMPGPDADARLVKRRRWLVYMGLFGAALLCGDGMITPAISVLSAVEGLEVATTSLSPVIVPVTCGILIALFVVQKRGTEDIGAVFGPTMLVWFTSLAVVGLPWVFRRPDVLAAISPLHAVRFFTTHGMHGFLVLGSVVLCVTGGEALYADMGHFGRRAIRRAWYGLALPALLINYFGQGALILEHPETAGNPFYRLVSGAWLYPLMTIATIAAIVASQALISGAFSLARQAVQLGYCPRLTIVHTSGKTAGQIFIPEVSAGLMVSCVALVLAFRESGRLAAAYGIAVTGTMAITSVLFYVAARSRWGWSRARAGALLALFLSFDLPFFVANAAKIPQGGWFPLAIAAAGVVVMTTWKRGRQILGDRIQSQTIPLEMFMADLAVTSPHRVPGTAVFMASARRGTPNVLLHHFKHNKVLHATVVILNIVTDGVPEVAGAERLRHKSFGQGVHAVTAHVGFMETPNVPALLEPLWEQGLPCAGGDVSYYLGRETLICDRHGEMATWRKRLFSALSRNSRAATDFFGLPPNRVVELGAHIEL